MCTCIGLELRPQPSLLALSRLWHRLTVRLTVASGKYGSRHEWGYSESDGEVGFLGIVISSYVLLIFEITQLSNSRKDTVECVYSMLAALLYSCWIFDQSQDPGKYQSRSIKKGADQCEMRS